MNARQAYLAWLRVTNPGIYNAAIRRVAGRPRSLGGLSTDLIAQMSRQSTGFGFLGDDYSDLPTIDVTADAPTMPDITPLDVTDLTPIDTSDLTSSVQLTPASSIAPAADSNNTTSGPSTTFNAITGAVASIITAGMSASASSSLLKLNTQRAQQGLPPVNAQGVPISTSGLPLSTNPTIARFEASMAGVASSPMLWLAGLGIAALLIFRSKRA